MKKTEPAEQNGQSGDIQRLGHQIASLAGVLVVALVEFGVPLTPGQQSSILSLIVTGWALASTIYGLRHRVVNTPPATPQARHRTKPRDQLRDVPTPIRQDEIKDDSSRDRNHDHA
jgi:hypothetical protein